MKKTTLYIEEDLVREIKSRTIDEPGKSMTDVINDALRSYLHAEPARRAARFKNLKKALGSSKALARTDPVKHQRKLRSEWD